MNFDPQAGVSVLSELISLGGPVVALLLAMSVVAGAVMLWKLGVFFRAGVGQHGPLHEALCAVDAGNIAGAQQALAVLAVISHRFCARPSGVGLFKGQNSLPG